jgi:hypothetical protein
MKELTTTISTYLGIIEAPTLNLLAMMFALTLFNLVQIDITPTQ